MEQSFEEWFNIYSKDHCKAYSHLMEKGVWPKGFIPDDVKLESNWFTALNARMASGWCKYVIT